MLHDITAFEAAALADCRRDRVDGYNAGSIAQIIERHGVDFDRFCELWDAAKKQMPPPPSNVIRLRGREGS